MKTDTFTLTFPNSALQPTYIDVTTVGTALAGLPQDAPLVVNMAQDVIVDHVGGGGDGVITVRASAPDTLRFRAKGIRDAQPVSVVVTQIE